MVLPSGDPTMLGQWRIAVRQAEESARAGRLEEALALLSRPEVAEHRQAVQLRARLARDLLARAKRRADADDLAGALDDLTLAEHHGAAPDALAGARLTLAERVAGEVQLSLDAGDPARALERIEAVARRQVSGPALRRQREAAEAWGRALDEGRRGEFGRSREELDRAGRLLGGAAAEGLAATRRDLEARQQAALPRVERLYKALGAGLEWGEILAAADSVLELVPEHPAARQARARAWQQIGALNPGAALPGRAERPAPCGPIGSITIAEPTHAAHGGNGAHPSIVFLDEPATCRPAAPAAARVEPGPKGRLLLWADTVGGFLVCLDGEVVLGRAGADSHADVPILGDLSRRHASLIRQGDGYVVRAYHPTFLNGRSVVGTAPVRDRDVLRLGSSVELLFRQPSPVSATARLELVSRHRLPLAVEGVVLMAETCIVGPPPQAHVPAPGLKAPVILFRQGGQLWCRAAGTFEVDGRSCHGRAALGGNSTVHGDGFSFSLEPLTERPATA